MREDEPEGFRSASRGRKLEGDELLESLQVLSVQFDVIVAGSLHPQGLDGAGAALVHGQAMGEVDHLILSAVNYQHWGRHLGHLVNAGGEKDRMVFKEGKLFLFFFWGWGRGEGGVLLLKACISPFFKCLLFGLD